VKTLHQIRIPIEEKNLDLLREAASRLGILSQEIDQVRVLKRSLDARGRKKYWIYSLEVFFTNEKTESAFTPFPLVSWKKGTQDPPLIIGAGPAGLFAAWTFLQHGICPILIERGERTHQRMAKISRFWRQGILDLESNVCYGEGGAGTFSDGKLITRIKSPHIARIMDSLVRFGAPPEIAHAYDPHVGSNRIREVIRKFSDHLIEQGADLRFQTRVDSLVLSGREVQGVQLQDGTRISCSGVILACGHSSRDLFNTLYQQGVAIEAKPFALGLRIEHSQEFINQWQYGCEMEELGAAQYKLTAHWPEKNLGVYTFCMCPGGYVIASSTDSRSTVVNGMSNYQRNSPWANSAVVCTVPLENITGSDPFRLMEFQHQIERNTYQAAQETHRIPAQKLGDFLAGRMSKIQNRVSCPSGIVEANLRDILPDWISRQLIEGFQQFEKKRRGFCHPDAILHAVESRTSSPIRIPRTENSFESINTSGLFPCGEGPGYAGGITSAAADGINAALAWVKKFATMV